MKKLLIIGHTFPEPATTAAGCRMMQLIELFAESGYEITFASTALASERAVNLKRLGIAVVSIQLNHASFDEFVSELKPTTVLFDRYITEEQFGWRVAEHCPDAIRILDTEDLHFLRKARKVAVKDTIPVEAAKLFTETAKRELASILRSDLSLIISETEMELLRHTFKIPVEILFYLPFIIETFSEEALPFEERSNFITIGNLLHAPNVDSVLYLKKEVWPLIKKELPEAKLHIYGAYAPRQILELHNEKEGFLIEGWAESVSEVMQKAKVCLAPLRFGAGLKGKLLDAMLYGTPSVTTSMGAEGMHGELPFSGKVSDTVTGFVDASVALYNNKTEWLGAQKSGFNIIEKRFRKDLFSEAFKEFLFKLGKHLHEHRAQNFIGEILRHQTMQSTRYMSKWIEAKNSAT